MKRDIDAEYSELLDELQEAVDENDPHGLRSDRVRVIRLRIEQLLRKYMSRAAQPADSRRTGPEAFNCGRPAYVGRHDPTDRKMLHTAARPAAISAARGAAARQAVIRTKANCLRPRIRA